MEMSDGCPTSPESPGHEGNIIPVMSTMTENDKRLTEFLTEGAPAPSQSEGNYRCPGYDHSYYPGPASEYPAGMIACPSRITGKHWCQLTSDQDDLARNERYLAGLRTMWDVGDRCAGLWESIEHRLNRSAVLRGRIAIFAAEHLAIHARYERMAVHATNKASAESKRGPWEFTLTYSPTEHGWNRDEAKEAMRTAIERLTRYYREEIEEFHAVGELTQAGAPHVHAWYRLDGGRRITTKSFKRAYPIWDEKRRIGRGHVGGHHEPVRRIADFAGYIEKDLETSWLNISITNAPAEETNRAEEAVSPSPSPAPSGSSSDAESDDR